MKLVPWKKQESEVPMMSLFDDFVDRFFEMPKRNLNAMMSMDVIENENDYKIVADLPGMKKEDVKISTGNGQLVIEAHREEKSEKKEKGNVVYSERYSGSYCRTIPIPGDIDPSMIKAKMNDGTLELIIPKGESSVRKEITIE